MVCLEPGDDIRAEFLGEGAEFVCFGTADGASGVVFSGVAFDAAGFQIVGIVLAGAAKDDGQGGEDGRYWRGSRGGCRRGG